MKLKTALQMDLDVFINPDEFADRCVINGRELYALIDSSVVGNGLEQGFQEAQFMGIYNRTIAVYIRQGDLDPLPPINAAVTVNGDPYICRNVTIERGLDVLTLEKREQ